MADGYGEIYGKIKTQRATVEERRKQLDKPVVAGTAKQRRILMRRVRKTPEYRKHIEAKEERLTALGEAEVEIGEYEGKIREYEEEGYEVEPTDEGHRFTKQVYVPGERRVVQREVSVMVYWRNPRTGKTGRFQGRQSQIADYERQLSVTGRSITSVTTIGGGTAYETTEGYWTTKDVVLAEAKPVYTQVKRDIDWAKIKTESPQLGFLLEYADPRQKRMLQKAITSRYPEKVRDVQFRLATATAFKSLTEPEKISYAKQYYTFGKEGKTWREFKEPDWELKIKEAKLVVATPLTDTSTLFKAMAKEYKKSPGIFGYVRAGTIAFTSWFRPETWIAGFKGGGPLSGGILGVQPRIGYGAAVETLRWEYPITKMEDPLHKFVAVARPAYETVVLPYVGGAILGKAGALFRGAKHVWSPGTKIVLGGTKVVVAGAMSTVIGADIGYTAAMERHGFLESGTLAAKISKYTVQFAFIGAGYKAGAAIKPGVITTKFRAVIDKAFPYRADLRFMKHYDPFTYKHGMFPSKIPKGIRGFRIGDRADIYMYGRKGMVSPYEGMTTLEQTMYKPSDPFMSYRAGGVWGAYETSWGFYRQGLFLEVPTRMPVVKRVPFKVTTEGGITVFKGDIFGRTGMAKIRTPILETGKMPSEFTTGKYQMRITYKRTPLKFLKVKTEFKDSFADIFIKEPTTTGLVTTKGVTPMRFRLKHDVTDYRFLRYLESLEPSYQPVTSRLAPVHISRFIGKDISLTPGMTFATISRYETDVKFDTISRSAQLSISALSHKFERMTKMEDLTSALSIQKSLSASINASLTDSMSAQRSMSALMTKQMLRQETLQKLKTMQRPYRPFKTPVTYQYTTEITPTPIIPKTPRPVAWFDSPEAEPRKRRKKKEEFDELFLGYRFRRWKVPTLKQMIGMEVW